jgi:hypothetical protein
MTDRHVANDLFRRTAKFLGATYKHVGHFEEAKTSAIASTETFHNQECLDDIAVATAVHYGYARILPEQVKQLYSFLRWGAHKIKPTSLSSVTQHAVRPL